MHPHQSTRQGLDVVGIEPVTGRKDISSVLPVDDEIA
jgi:hypothetical protein